LRNSAEARALRNFRLDRVQHVKQRLFADLGASAMGNGVDCLLEDPGKVASFLASVRLPSELKKKRPV
jgi:hypothetical protein